MNLHSNAFRDGGVIPDKYAHNGRNVSPPLNWDGAPKGTKAFALVVDDPDAPSGDFLHWIIYDIPPGVSELPEGVPKSRELGNGARQARNDFGEIGYGGPQPPSGTHRYFFHLYALDEVIVVPPEARREQIENAIREHAIDECQIMGKYQHH
jgi:Raf kinase inhibitor-like YbhB/YbcL family protein